MNVVELKAFLSEYRAMCKLPMDQWRQEMFAKLDSMPQFEPFFMDSTGELCLNCGDVFAYACADAEAVPDDEFQGLMTGIERFGTCDAEVAYVSVKRNDLIPVQQITLNPDAVAYFKSLNLKPSKDFP